MSLNKSKKEQINIYNKFIEIKQTAIRCSIPITKSNNFSFHCYLVDNDWLNIWKKHVGYNSNKCKNKKNNTEKISIEPCKTLDSFEEVKYYILNNKQFEIVNDDFINSLNYCFTENAQFFQKEIYIGFDKVIICFNENNYIRYLLNMIKEKEYYELNINDKTVIKGILYETYENIFNKKSKFKYINFIPLNNANNTKSIYYSGTNNVYIYNPNANSTSKISNHYNNESQNDIVDETDNRSIVNSINNFNNNSLKIDKKDVPKKSKVNIKNNNQNNKSQNLKIPKKEKEIEKEKEKEKEKEEDLRKIYYEKEKEKLLLQKKINESLLNDLSRINSLPKLMKKKDILEKDIEKTKQDIDNQNERIKKLKKEIELKRPKQINSQNEEEKIGERSQKRKKSYRNQLKEEQMIKRQELEDKYKNILLQDKIKELKQKIYIKDLYEEKLKEKQNDLNKLFETIKTEFEYEKEFNKKQEFIKLIIQQNQDELEKLNTINSYEEELKKVQKDLEEKEKRKREEEIKINLAKKEEEEKKQIEEMNRKKKEEELNRIRKEKEEELIKLEEEHNKKREEYYEQIKKQESESKELLDKQKEKIKIKRNQFEEQIQLQKQIEEEEKRRQKEAEEEKLKQKMQLEIFLKKKERDKQEEMKIKRQREMEEERLKQQQQELELQEILKNDREHKELEEKMRRQKEIDEINRIQTEKEKEELMKQQRRKQEELEREQKRANIITCKSFITPPLIGLENIGATCYMNATLQCLSQTEVLTNYFLNEKNVNKIINNNIAKKNPNQPQLSPSYLNLINNLWKLQNKKTFAPTEFRKTLAIMNDLFKEGLPNDAKDLVYFILIQLHEELNLYGKNKNMNNMNNVNNVNNNMANQFDEQLILQMFIKDFFKVNCSIMSDHFYGITETKILCSECQRKNKNNNLLPIKFSFQTFNFLIFPLEEVRIFKNNKLNMNNMNMLNQMNMNQMNMMNQFNMNNQMGGFNNNFIFNNIFLQNNNVVNIYDCFDYNQKEEIFSGDNAMWCNECKGLFQSKNQTIIYTGPNILILILNRGRGIQYKIKLEYYETINLDNYILKKDKPSMIYDLYGVVTHLGESGDSGHFVASCKSPCDNKWYRYNDSIVHQIFNIKSEIIDLGNSYILFYQKRQ